MPPLVFKPLGPDNVLINPFKVHKTQVLEYTAGSGNVNELNVVTAIDFLDPINFDPDTEIENEDGTLQGPLFKSIQHIFYASGAMSGSATFAAAGSGIRDFPLSGSAYVLNIPQQLFGEGILPGSFVLKSIDSASFSASIFDDAQGRLIVCGSDGTQHIVGNIFYDLGIAVIRRFIPMYDGEIFYDGTFFYDGEANLL